MSTYGTKEYLIKNKVYDIDLYNALTDKSFKGEKLTQEEHDYTTYCYHYEEYQAGLL